MKRTKIGKTFAWIYFISSLISSTGDAFLDIPAPDYHIIIVAICILYLFGFDEGKVNTGNS